MFFFLSATCLKKNNTTKGVLVKVEKKKTNIGQYCCINVLLAIKKEAFYPTRSFTHSKDAKMDRMQPHAAVDNNA